MKQEVSVNWLGVVSGSCKHSEDTSAYIKNGNYLRHLEDYRLLNEGSALNES
jgi:hypothetical protein